LYQCIDFFSKFFLEIFGRTHILKLGHSLDATFLLERIFFGWILDFSYAGYVSTAGTGLCLRFSLAFVEAFNTI
jgi:hypothetical protein